MKKLVKLFAVLAIVFSSITGLLGLGEQAEAYTGDNVDITLHKKGFENNNGEVPGAVENSGTDSLPGWTDPTGNITNLQGVEFTLFDVADAYYALIAASSETNFKDKQKEAVAAIQAAAQGQKEDFTLTIGGHTFNVTKLSSNETGATGTVLFEDLDNKDGSGNRDAVYLFVETGSPYPTLKPEEPMVVALPVYLPDGSAVNQDIHIFPKNDLQDEIGEKEYVGTEVTITEDGYGTVNIGDELDYKITIPVTDLMNKVVIKDTPSTGLEYKDGSAELNGHTVTVVPDGNGGFSYEISGANLDSFRGGTIELTYTMVVTDEAIPDEVMDNEATISINDGPDTDIGEGPNKPEFFTGGKKFIKRGVDGVVLEGAEFVVVKLDSAGNVISYLERDPQTDSNGTVKWVVPADLSDPSSWSTAQVITSENDGTFEVTGLEYSEALENGESYALVERKAPDGYVVLDEPFAFQIIKDEYKDGISIDVENIPSGYLPETGGKGIYLFLLIGAALMGGAVIWYKRSRKHSAQV